MPEILAYCGLDFGECPAYKMLKKDDPVARKKAAAEWSKMFKAEIKPSDMFCAGCSVTDGRHFAHCAECEYRACGQKKKVKNCGRCGEYPCAKIAKFHEMVPDAKVRLDKEKAKRK
jgi:hypothetical protein